MNRALWDHSFKIIGDMNELSPTFIRDKLVQLNALRSALIARGDEDAATTIVKPYIDAFLERCLDRYEGGRHIGDGKYIEYFNYAANAAVAVDERLSQKYQDLQY